MTTNSNILITALELPVPASMKQYLEQTCVRLGSQYPALSFSCNAVGLVIDGGASDQHETIRKAALHALYRQKIYEDTLDMRRALVGALISQ